MPLPTQTLANNYGDWSVQYSMYTMLSGKLRLTNQEQQYNRANTLWVPVQLGLAATVDSDLVDDSSLAGSTSWFNGLITSFTDQRQIAGDFMDVNLGSYFTTLSTRPINSQFYVVDVATVLTDVLNVYAGIPLALLSFSLGNRATIYGVVQGNDLMEETRKLAAAGASDLFVQVGGVLTVEAWKDETSSVDITLPDEVVIECKSVRTRTKGASRIYLRGRWTGSYGCGQKLINVDPTQPPSRISRDHCYHNGVREAVSDMYLNNLAANKEDLRNAGFLLSGDQTFGTVTELGETGGDATLRVTPTVGATLPPLTLSTTEILALARTTGSEENNDTSSKSKGTDAALSQHDRVLSALTNTPPGTFRGGSGDSSKTSDAPDKNRLEMAVQDNGLVSEFGVVTEDLDNPYLAYGLNAFSYGIRKFKEFRMQRNTYEVIVAYLPGVRLNHVVTFTVPDGTKTVTGRVSDIAVNYKAGNSEVSMTLKVESFEELGVTSYTSGNLLTYPELCGINGVNWVINSGDIYAISGYFAFDGAGAVRQPIFLAAGLSFDLTVKLILDTGPGVFNMRHYNVAALGGSSINYSASGTYTYSFTPTTYDVTIEFAATSGVWFMTTPHLSVTVTA